MSIDWNPPTVTVEPLALPAVALPIVAPPAVAEPIKELPPDVEPYGYNRDHPSGLPLCQVAPEEKTQDVCGRAAPWHMYGVCLRKHRQNAPVCDKHLASFRAKPPNTIGVCLTCKLTFRNAWTMSIEKVTRHQVNLFLDR